MGLERLLEETPEAYYWMGFLFADGHFDKRNTIHLTISIKDKDHIEKYADFINYPKNNIRYLSTTNSVAVSKSNKDIFLKIIEKFSISQRKSTNPQLPRSHRYPSAHIKPNKYEDSLLISNITNPFLMYQSILYLHQR